MLKYFIFSFLFFIQISDNDYHKIFGDDYTNALNYFSKNKSIIDRCFTKYQVDEVLLIPVVFPERIRFSMVRDLIETIAVEQVYIEYGSDYVDFSIGDFQLKPSFASKIENALIENSTSREKYAILLKYSQTEIKEIRKERVRRLKSLEFQLIYLAAFYDIVMQKFDLSNKSQTEKIAFLATAYNYGFLSTQSEIEEHIGDQYFPFGAKYRGKQYSYSDVAVDFYINQFQ